MANYIVQQGDCLSSLAARFGFAGWEQLLDHPANEELKKKRPNPNVLAPGDEVVLPDRAPEKFVPIVTTRTHIFNLKVEDVKLRIALVDRTGKPYEVKRFIVNIGAREIKGTNAPGGMVEVKVPATASTGRLRVWLGGDGPDDNDAPPSIDRDLAIGHIDPIDTNSGVQGRLANLGYGCPIADGTDTQVDDRLLAAARSFRARHDLPEVEPPAEAAEGDEPSDGDDAAAAYAERLFDEDFRNKLLAVYESSAQS